MSGQDVYNLLLPKREKKGNKGFKKNTVAADPRLSASITWSEIKKYGTKII